jgi:glycosyltransferase involved in cell wall biosynthesis
MKSLTMKKLKVGLLFDGPSIPALDGVTNRALNVARSLKNKQYNFIFLLGDRGWTTDKQLINEGFDSLLFPSKWLYDKTEIFKLVQWIKTLNIDVLHICNSHQVILSFAKHLSLLTSIPLICDIHDVDSQLFKSLKKDKSIISESELLQTIACKCSDFNICMSPRDYSQLIELKIDKNKLAYIPNGMERVQSITRSKAANKIIFLGNMYYPPNFEAAKFVLSISKTVLEKIPEAEFLFIGRTPIELKKYSNSRIHFLGEQSDLNSVLSEGIVGLAPIFSGSGMKVKPLTYATYQLPVIASREALVGYEDHKKLFIRANSKKEFIKSIIDVFKNKKKHIDLGRRLSRFLFSKYNWDKATDKLIKIYKKIKKKDQLPPIKALKGNPTILETIDVPLPFWLTEKRFDLEKKKRTSLRIIKNKKVKYLDYEK